MRLSGWVRPTSRSSARLLPGIDGETWRHYGENLKEILRISLSESSEEHIEPSRCVGRTSPKAVTG